MATVDRTMHQLHTLFTVDVPETVSDSVVRVVEEAGRAMTTADIIEAVGSPAGTVKPVLTALVKSGALYRPRHGYYDRPARTRVADPSSDYAYPFHEGGVGGGQAAVQYQSEEGRLFVFAPREVVAGWTGGRVPSPQEAYWTKVRGTSMEPWLPDGSPIFVATCDRVLDGGRYVIYLDDDDAEVVKRVERIGGGYLRLISDNPAHTSRTLRHLEDDMYEDQEFHAKVRVRVRGVVLYPTDTAHATVRLIARHARGE